MASAAASFAAPERHPPSRPQGVEAPQSRAADYDSGSLRPTRSMLAVRVSHLDVQPLTISRAVSSAPLYPIYQRSRVEGNGVSVILPARYLPISQIHQYARDQFLERRDRIGALQTPAARSVGPNLRPRRADAAGAIPKRFAACPETHRLTRHGLGTGWDSAHRRSGASDFAIQDHCAI